MTWWLLPSVSCIGIGRLLCHDWLYRATSLDSVADSLNDQIQVSNILNFRFRATPISLIIAYCLGVLLTFIVVTYCFLSSEPFKHCGRCAGFA